MERKVGQVDRTLDAARAACRSRAGAVANTVSERYIGSMTSNDRTERAEFRAMATQLRQRRLAILKAQFEALKNQQDADSLKLRQLEWEIEREFDYWNPAWMSKPLIVIAVSVIAGLLVVGAGITFGALIAHYTPHEQSIVIQAPGPAK
jgi:hypothetical protein